MYDLSLGTGSSDGFYVALAEFSDRVLAAIRRRTGSSIDDFSSYVRVELREAERSRGEYELDLLILGLLLGRYLGAAEDHAGLGDGGGARTLLAPARRRRGRSRRPMWRGRF